MWAARDPGNVIRAGWVRLARRRLAALRDAIGAPQD
jgi:hypothetical protein